MAIQTLSIALWNRGQTSIFGEAPALFLQALLSPLTTPLMQAAFKEDDWAWELH